MDGNAKDYHGRLNLFTSGTVAYSTHRKLGTHTAEFSGQGFLHQNAHECFSIGSGLRMWGWFRLDGTQATSIYNQNIISLGNMASQSSAGTLPTVTGAGGITYTNLGAGASTSVGPMQTYQQNQFDGYTQTATRRGAWPVPTPTWSFFHLTFTSTGCISHTGTENQTTLSTDHMIGANKFFGSTTLLPVFIGGGGSTDSRKNAGYDGGGSTTGATTIKIENVGFSTSIDNYTAKATNLFNSGTGRVCPAST
jgi:hypothetical protein